MGQKEKLIEQLKSRPKTFTFHDAEVLLDYLEFTKSNKGKTSGSRVMFTSEEHGSILLHKPHPSGGTLIAKQQVEQRSQHRQRAD